jgi:hypothetical protein
MTAPEHDPLGPICIFCNESLWEPNSVCSHHESQIAVAKAVMDAGKNPDMVRCGQCGACVNLAGPCPECGDAKPLDYLDEEEPGDGTDDDTGNDDPDDEDEEEDEDEDEEEPLED